MMDINFFDGNSTGANILGSAVTPSRSQTPHTQDKSTIKVKYIKPRIGKRTTQTNH